MRLREENLELTTRKAIALRMLRSRFETGVMEERDYLVMHGRIQQARSLAEIDALISEVEAK